MRHSGAKRLAPPSDEKRRTQPPVLLLQQAACLAIRGDPDRVLLLQCFKDRWFTSGSDALAKHPVSVAAAVQAWFATLAAQPYAVSACIPLASIEANMSLRALKAQAGISSQGASRAGCGRARWCHCAGEMESETLPLAHSYVQSRGAATRAVWRGVASLERREELLRSETGVARPPLRWRRPFCTLLQR